MKFSKNKKNTYRRRKKLLKKKTKGLPRKSLRKSRRKILKKRRKTKRKRRYGGSDGEDGPTEESLSSSSTTSNITNEEKEKRKTNYKDMIERIQKIDQNINELKKKGFYLDLGSLPGNEGRDFGDMKDYLRHLVNMYKEIGIELKNSAVGTNLFITYSGDDWHTESITAEKESIEKLRKSIYQIISRIELVIDNKLKEEN